MRRVGKTWATLCPGIAQKIRNVILSGQRVARLSPKSSPLGKWMQQLRLLLGVFGFFFGHLCLCGCGHSSGIVRLPRATTTIMLENLDTSHAPPGHMQQPSPSTAQQQMRQPKLGQWQRHPAHTALINDEMRFQIIDAVYLRPGIWDSTREKSEGTTRKTLFAEITTLLNQQVHAQGQEPLTCEEVEKQWKNLKDTYNKTRKKVTFDNEGRIIPPKWKFFPSMMFLDDIAPVGSIPVPVTQLAQNGPQASGPRHIRSRSEDSEGIGPRSKRARDADEDEEDDEYIGFCRSLVYSLREIGEKDRIKWIHLQKTIRDTIHEAHLEALLSPPAQQQQQPPQQHHMMR